MKFRVTLSSHDFNGRPPHGGRGLKWLMQPGEWHMTESPPARGAWIEIVAAACLRLSATVAPRTGGVD